MVSSGEAHTPPEAREWAWTCENEVCHNDHEGAVLLTGASDPACPYCGGPMAQHFEVAVLPYVPASSTAPRPEQTGNGYSECSRCGMKDDTRRTTCLHCGGQMQVFSSTAPRDQEADVREAAETLLYALVELLPVEGSMGSGFHVSDRIDATVKALPEEWATAAHHFVELDAALRASTQPQACSPGADSTEPNTPQAEEESRG